MPTTSVRACADRETAARLRTAAHEDGTALAQLAARALTLHAGLPRDARRGLQFVSEHGSGDDQIALGAAVARAVALTQLRVARRALLERLAPEVRAPVAAAAAGEGTP